MVLGIQGYFERGSDLVYVSGAIPDATTASGFKDAKLFILGVDTQLDHIQLVRSLELPGGIARGILVENNQTLLAMGLAGMGIVDSYLPAKAYLMVHRWLTVVFFLSTKMECIKS